MLIFRYLFKEVFLTLIALTGILMLVFMSNQFVRYLGRAVSGQFPVTVILKLMMLEIPNLAALLLPLGFYIALLIALGRLYADSEMAVLYACGYSPKKLLTHVMVMAMGVFFSVFFLVMWLSPEVAMKREKLIRSSGLKTLIQTVMPGRFTPLPGGRDVLYVTSMNRDHTKADRVFLVRESKDGSAPSWRILLANKAKLLSTNKDYLVLKNGKEYAGAPGRHDFEIVKFDDYRMKLPEPTIVARDDMRILTFAALWDGFRDNIKKRTELEWRFSIAWMVIMLTLLAVPLSRVNPRSGKFARLLPAILIYILYANGLFVMRDALLRGKISSSFSMLWVHVLVLIIGVVLYRRSARMTR